MRVKRRVSMQSRHGRLDLTSARGASRLGGDARTPSARARRASGATERRGDAHHHYAHDEGESEPADEAEVGEQAPDLEPLEHGGKIQVQRAKVQDAELHADGGQHARGAPRAAHRRQALVPIARRLRHRVCRDWRARALAGRERWWPRHRIRTRGSSVSSRLPKEVWPRGFSGAVGTSRGTPGCARCARFGASCGTSLPLPMSPRVFRGRSSRSWTPPARFTAGWSPRVVGRTTPDGCRRFASTRRW